MVFNPPRLRPLLEESGVMPPAVSGSVGPASVWSWQPLGRPRGPRSTVETSARETDGGERDEGSASGNLTTCLPALSLSLLLLLFLSLPPPHQCAAGVII